VDESCRLLTSERPVPDLPVGCTLLASNLSNDVHGVERTFEIGVRSLVSGNTEVIMRRFFRLDL
jgi:hypothetical protein